MYSVTEIHIPSEFEIAENKGREKALAILNKIELADCEYVIKTTKNDCRWDFEVREKANNRLICIVEAKDRKFPSTKGNVFREGVQLEETKFDALCSMAMRKGIPAYYLATFTDNRYYLWDVTTAPHTEDDRMCNKTTAVDKGKVMKHCYYFKTKDANFKGDIE